MRILFMGSPDFAVPCLEKLYDFYQVVGVVTQPDKPKGRGQKMQPNPVKQKALELGITVYQPDRLRKDTELIETLKKLELDLMVVVAFGQILPQEVLSIPKYGCINVHASLLPELRGAAPINWAIIRGYKKTGITTMMMDEGIDTGDMLLRAEVDMDEDETAEQLHDKLMVKGSELLIDTIKLIESGKLVREKQDGTKYTYAPMLSKEMGNIDWSLDSSEIYNLIRGIIPWPGAYSFLNKKMIKLMKVKKSANTACSKPGQILSVGKDGIEVCCGKGSIIVSEIQEIGGRKMDIASYLNGHSINVGDLFEMGAE